MIYRCFFALCFIRAVREFNVALELKFLLRLIVNFSGIYNDALAWVNRLFRGETTLFKSLRVSVLCSLAMSELLRPRAREIIAENVLRFFAR